MARRSISRIIRKLLTFPFSYLYKTVQYCLDLVRSTYGSSHQIDRLSPLFRPDLATTDIDLNLPNLIVSTDHYLAHQFDLLGSGWTKIEYGMQCRGLHGHYYLKGAAVNCDTGGNWLAEHVNRGNLAKARRIWALVDSDYEPIDWQIDFRSGYRWSAKQWYQHIPFRDGGGIDIKVPWELARMQHLTQLAWAFRAARARQSGFQLANVYAREFRNEVLDFCANNPPRFGVNWRCTMDVAIRVANWAISYDLFRIHGAEFDSEFESVLASGVYDHAEYILKHLEWFDHGRGNHYLANIVGLLFAAAFLPRTDRTDPWVEFGFRELLKEVEHQFHADGSGAEASTAYHCLCTEMVAYATALVLGFPDKIKARLATSSLKDSPFPKWYSERLEKMAEFILIISKPTNLIPQIGDNDSGRFVIFFPLHHNLSMKDAKNNYMNLDNYVEMAKDDRYLMADNLDCRHVVAAISGLFHGGNFDEFTDGFHSEVKIAANIASNIQLTSYPRNDMKPDAQLVRIGSNERKQDLLDDWQTTPLLKRSRYDFPVNDSSAHNVTSFGFPDFGLYILRYQGAYVSIRCGAMGKNVVGAHAHNDQLSIELNIDDRDIIKDPGTYLYMPVPKLRNKYRSVTAHFAPQALNMEPSPLNEHVFYLDHKNEGECLYFGSSEFIGRHRGPGFEFYRYVTLGPTGVTVLDWSPMNDLISLEKVCPLEFSPGYGMRLAAKEYLCGAKKQALNCTTYE